MKKVPSSISGRIFQSHTNVRTQFSLLYFHVCKNIFAWDWVYSRVSRFWNDNRNTAYAKVNLLYKDTGEKGKKKLV
jgi:hypothetical protein